MTSKYVRAQLLGVSAAARILNLSDTSVSRLADEGRLPHQRDSAGRRLFKLVHVVALAKKRQKLPSSRRSEVE